MWLWFAVFAAYIVARRKNWGIREWLEIALAGICLFFLFHM